ncbi:heterokaryon incompatibility protein-domain-containing protein [Cercophora scortea]|uniref:Heterokaryon incompatibility protein-domain-containing protein n=1 Tax=Cercophora scortea TaxID=314031 RepID=A0AAE0IN95_9PEZI|nr:heterokaryon incompatibility protein-domain-containing protein [Cercophora scortea]
MRLLNAETRRLETFFGDEIPKYAILSHTWGDDEVLYEDICDPLKPLPLSKPGFLKIDFTCKQALLDNYRYAWVDTCCIDKQSSAELSEAINSMFLWYLNAEICYAYLADVTFNPSDGSARGRFEDSRWFTRGWTLQELIAPRNVQFFDSQWSFLGYRQPQALHSDRKFLLETRDCLSKNIHERTGVPTNVLLWNAPSEDVMEQWLFPKSNKERLDKVLHRCSVAQKMSWASRRSTKRIEDEAYSLLGIFGVHMPLLYGEGRRAFFRLQLEIMGVCDDQSIFAFLQDGQGRGLPEPLLAVSPAPFANSSDMVHIPPTANIWGKRPVPLLGLSPSSKTVEMEMHICPLKSSLPGNGIPELPEMRYYLAILSSAPRLDLDNPTGLVLGTYNVESGQFYRVESRSLPVISPLSVKGALMIAFYFRHLAT